LKEIVNDIKKNSTWLASIAKKAEENSVSLDAQLKLDAEYILSSEIISPKETVEQIAERIRNDETWMKEIKKKAEDNNISLDQQVKEDAQWTFDNSK
jgi:hypothetical protein